MAAVALSLVATPDRVASDPAAGGVSAIFRRLTSLPDTATHSGNREVRRNVEHCRSLLAKRIYDEWQLIEQLLVASSKARQEWGRGEISRPCSTFLS
jgi:hypothetical protein